MPEEEDTPEMAGDTEIALNEGDRPISTDAYLDEDGICFFPGPEADMPSALRIAAPINFLKFVKAAVVLDNDSEEGFKTVKWAYPDPSPGGVIGLVLNRGAIAKLQEAYNGRAFLLQAPNKTGQWLTLAEWNSEFKTDGLDVLSRMRWEWFTKGGGVGTPGQQVTGTHQKGQPKVDPGKKFLNLGGKDGRKW